MFCIFDGHGGNGMLAAKSSAQHLTALLDKELRTYYEVRCGIHDELCRVGLPRPPWQLLTAPPAVVLYSHMQAVCNSHHQPQIAHGCDVQKAAAHAACSHMHVPALLSLQRSSDAGQGLRGALEVIISEAFAEAEKAVSDSGVDLTNSGTTAAVAVQRGNQLWLAAAGDSRALLCSKGPDGGFRAQPLSLDHRPSRPSETARWGQRHAAELVDGAAARETCPGVCVGFSRLVEAHSKAPQGSMHTMSEEQDSGDDVQ